MKTYDRNIASLVIAFAAIAAILLAARSVQANSFADTGSLNAGRGYHTATLLSNGKVLAAGGSDNSIGVLSSAELYDPAAGTWAGTGSLNTGRDFHTATLLANGKVLVVGGGGSSGILSSAELYNPAAGTWAGTGSLNAGRVGHMAILLPNGKVLVMGGGYSGGYLSSAELYDPATGTWATTGSLNSARAYHMAVLLANGKVLVAGGYNSGGYLSSAELYDPAAGTWSTTGSLNTGRGYFTATLLHNGKVLVAGGAGSSGPLSSAELYNPAAGTWATTGSLNTGRSEFTATLLPNGKVLIVAGAGILNLISSAELYDPSAGTWATTDSLSTSRYYHTAVSLFNGKVLVVGGSPGDDNALSSAELYETVEASSISTLIPIESQSEDYLGSMTDNSAGSGITYWPSRNTYLVLDNNPRQLHEFNRSVPPTLQRTITLADFLDPEDIHWISGNTFVIAQELHAFSGPDSIDELVVIDLPTSGSSVNISTATRRLQINTSTFTSSDNKGIEGVTYLGGNFYFTTEETPSSGAWNVWTVPNSGSTGTVIPTAAFSLPSLIENRATDISGMATDGTYLWFLSDDGPPGATKGRVLIMTVAGQLIGDYQLPNFSGGGTWDQAEGIELFVDSGDIKILLTGEKNNGTGVDFMVLSE